MVVSGNSGISKVTRVYSDQIKVSGKNTKTAAAGQAEQKDEVILSSHAQEFAHLLQRLRDSSGVREDLVDSLSDKIDSGSYNISSGAVADKMIAAYRRSESER